MDVVKLDADPPNNGHGSRRLESDFGSAPPSGDSPQPTEVPAGRWLYADKPLEPGDKDSLSFGAYADALALLMDWKDTSTPLTIAINGPWGSGKTSLAKMAEARLPIGSDWDAPHVICWFDAWANDDAPHLGAAFAAAVALAVNKQRRWWTRLVMPLPSVMLSPEQRWRRRLWLGVLAVVLAAVAIFWPTGGSLLSPFLHPGAKISDLTHGTVATRLAWPVLVVAVIVLAQWLAPGIQGVARWIDNPGSEAARGSMKDANRQLGQLVGQALRGKRRLMIFVDNLERCRPPRAVDVCEVVSQLIGHPEVVTVLVGDMDTIALSAEIKYAELESVSHGVTGTPRTGGARGITGTRSVGAYGRAYLEKLIQIQLRLPPPVPSDLRKMLVPVADERPAFPRSASELQPRSLFAVTGKIIALFARLRRFRRLWPAIVIIVITGGAAVLIYWVWSSPKRTDLATFGGFLIAVAVPAAALITYNFRDYQQRRAQRKRRHKLDDIVSSEVGPTEKALRPDAIKKVAQQVNDIDENEIRRRMRQRIISPGNELRTELDRAVLEILPPSPRAAKRMFNHAHLLLDIGVERGIFTKKPTLQAGQLAAWVALIERWPSVAAAIANDPTLLGRLEELAQQTAREALRPEQVTAMENDTGIIGLDSSLLDYLRRSDSLVPCVRLLVNFSPDAEEESAPDVEGSVTRTDSTAGAEKSLSVT